MRPLVVKLERALQAAMHAGLQVPTKPAPRIEAAADGSGRQWVEAEIDFQRLRRELMSSLEQSGAYSEPKQSSPRRPASTLTAATATSARGHRRARL